MKDICQPLGGRGNVYPLGVNTIGFRGDSKTSREWSNTNKKQGREQVGIRPAVGVEKQVGHPLIHLSIHPPIHPLIYSCTHPRINPSTCLWKDIHPMCVFLSTYQSINQFIYLSIYLSSHPQSIHQSIHPSIHP